MSSNNFVRHGFELITAFEPEVLDMDSDQWEVQRPDQPTMERRVFETGQEGAKAVIVGDSGVMVQPAETSEEAKGVSVEWDAIEQDQEIDVDLGDFAEFYEFSNIEDFEFAARVLGRFVEAIGGTPPIEQAARTVKEKMEEWTESQSGPVEDSWRRVLNRMDISSSAKAALRNASGCSVWDSQEKHSNDPAANAVRKFMNDGNMMEEADDEDILRRLMRKVTEMDEKLNRLDKSRSNVEVMVAYCDT